MKLTAATRLYGLFGAPVRHSLSPVLQNGWIQDHGLDAVYLAFDVADDGFETALGGLLAAGLAGANVTLPFKERALAVATSASAEARAAGAANTLVPGPDGLHADNTDGVGFLLDLDQRAAGWRSVADVAVVFGSGGAARGIASVLSRQPGLVVRLVARNAATAGQLARDLGLPPEAVFGWDQAAAALDGADLAVNATSIGLKGDGALTPDFSAMHPAGLVYDTVYTPRQTAFLTAAEAAGRAGLSGLGMLAGQGAVAFERWFGIRPDFATGLARLEAELV